MPFLAGKAPCMALDAGKAPVLSFPQKVSLGRKAWRARM